MIRTIGIALTLIAGSATAGEPMDCYNDESDLDIRYTSMQPDVLRVTDADISGMLARIRESESRSVAAAERDTALQLSLGKVTSASD
jgi:hypothetical protein